MNVETTPDTTDVQHAGRNGRQRLTLVADRCRRYTSAFELASISFGDLRGCCKLAGLDTECLGEGTNGARRWRCTPGFEARDRQRMYAGSSRELGL